jgi:hypothetical protein
MERIEFDQIFDQLVVRPLVAVGFTRKGKSLHLVRRGMHLAFVRLGGRMSSPRTAAWVLCFRHAFLRTIQPESDAAALKFDVFDFPSKFTVSELKDLRVEFRYLPRLLNYDYDRFDYGTRTNAAVKADLEVLRDFLLRSVVSRGGKNAEGTTR